MFDFLNKVLGIEIKKVENAASKKLPIYIANEYEILECVVENIPCMLLRHRGEINLAQMKKHYQIVSRTTGVQCAFVLDQLTTYQRQRLIESHISFVVPDRQVYIPFIGVLLQSTKSKKQLTASTLSFSAQKILITAILENWGECTMSEIANRTGYSRMSVSRFLDEIENNLVDSLKSIRNKRILAVKRESTMKQTYDQIREVLRDPVIKKIPLAYLPDQISSRIAGGYSALSKLSMIADNDYPTISITKKDYHVMEKAIHQAKSQAGEEPAVLLEVWEYLIPGMDKSVPDPISLAITMESSYPDDDRTVQAVDTMLREYKW